MNYRIAGRYNIYYSYDSAEKNLDDGEWIETYCPDHGWGPTTSSGECLACERQGLTSEEGVVE